MIVRAQIGSFFLRQMPFFFAIFLSCNIWDTSQESIYKQLQRNEFRPQKVESWESNRRFYFLVSLAVKSGAKRCDMYLPEKDCEKKSKGLVLYEERFEIDSPKLNPPEQKKRFLRKNLLMQYRPVQKNTKSKQHKNSVQENRNKKNKVFSIHYTDTKNDAKLARALSYFLRNYKNCKTPFSIRLKQSKSDKVINKEVFAQAPYEKIYSFIKKNCFFDNFLINKEE